MRRRARGPERAARPSNLFRCASPEAKKPWAESKKSRGCGTLIKRVEAAKSELHQQPTLVGAEAGYPIVQTLVRESAGNALAGASRVLGAQVRNRHRGIKLGSAGSVRSGHSFQRFHGGSAGTQATHLETVGAT